MFGVADSRFGQAVCAVVGLADGRVAADADLIEYVRGRVAAYKVPRRIAFTLRVPRAPNGKADYAAAKQLFAEAFPM